ncbi:zinc finger protein 260 isoform X1 [Helicoverpa armigera]|nr:zinc finger protein 260-like isoform X1 [Helicoverpa zea]XP_049694667.1 zinc finger protein 260 isoform X1 [Helicoverpa armigera]
MNTLVKMETQNYETFSKDVTSWQRRPFRVAGAGPSMPPMRAGSMEPLPPAHTPIYEHKKHRLSRLLDKLAVQLNNNNNYPTPSWLVHDTPQTDEAPLDLSVKSPRETTGNFTCHACGQEFSIYDRLVKHIASRHRSKPEGVRAYECEVCFRKFARSDMLTRHARLHSGVKPYSCASCGQVFSRSDHLATHQRTHTGEKPYRCPSCPYAACRRDMITRHMRTHLRRPQPA